MDNFKRFLNQSKIDGIVNNHLNTCNLHQFSFELKQHVASHYEKNSIKLTTIGILCMWLVKTEVTFSYKSHEI